MKPTFTIETIERKIYLIRGQKVMLDSDLAALYRVATGALNRAVKRNTNRFPEDFMFQLTAEESDALRCQTGILELHDYLRSPMVTSKTGRGGRRYQPYVFTEQGVAMLSSVLNSDRAVQVNITIMRAFVKLREMIASHKELAKRLDEMEGKYDLQFKIVFDAIRALITKPEPKEKKIGFIKENRAFYGTAAVNIR
ncbi:MAG: ORF6N domain-containing protein [Nitrospirota bacterium]